MGISNHKTLGDSGEAEAMEFLKAKGYSLRHKNFRTRRGELDLVMFHNSTLVFIEVKSDFSGQAGTPEEWVTPSKQKKLQKLAQSYCSILNVSMELPMRFDVVCIDKSRRRPEIRHIENAFLPDLNHYY